MKIRRGSLCLEAIDVRSRSQLSSRPRFAVNSERVGDSAIAMAKTSQDGMSIATA
jgi:hypothetical protein